MDQLCVASSFLTLTSALRIHRAERLCRYRGGDNCRGCILQAAPLPVTMARSSEKASKPKRRNQIAEGTPLQRPPRPPQSGGMTIIVADHKIHHALASRRAIRFPRNRWRVVRCRHFCWQQPWLPIRRNCPHGQRLGVSTHFALGDGRSRSRTSMASGPLSIVKMTLSRSRADMPMQTPMHHPAFEPSRSRICLWISIAQVTPSTTLANSSSAQSSTTDIHR